MKTVDLYNLYMGDTMPPERFAKCDIGPFRVELAPDYTVKVGRLGMHASKTVSRESYERESPDDPIIEVTESSFSQRRLGSWEVTATATFDDNAVLSTSVLDSYPPQDGGVSDLCTLLTFVTGRRVAAEQHLERYDPNKYGAPACIDIEALRAAAVAWENRTTLVQRGLTYALLLYNEALSQNMLQILSGLHNTVLDVLTTRWQMLATTIPASAKAELRDKVGAAVDTCVELSPDEKETFKNLLWSRINEGPGSMTDRTRSLLVDLGIVGAEPGPGAIRRIKLVNRVRNNLTHTGEPPKVNALTREQASRYTTSIVAGVVPEINRMALGKVLGFNRHAVGSLSQHPDELRGFFENGVWRGWPIEKLAFEDWFHADFKEIAEASQ